MWRGTMTPCEYYELVKKYWKSEGCEWANNAEMHRYYESLGHDLGHNRLGVTAAERVLQPHKIIVYKVGSRNWTIHPDFVDDFERECPTARRRD